MRIRNWREFQHYSKRNPPWVKLHVKLMSSQDWVLWNDASRVLAVACLMIASGHDGEVPENAEYIKRVAYLSDVPDFKPLIDSGFLEVASEAQADASALLASACNSVSVSASGKESVRENQNGGYAFESGVIRLKEDAYRKWKAAFKHLNLDAELIGVSDWASKQSNWFVAVSSFLTKRDRLVRVELEKAKANGGFTYKSGIEGVI